MKPLLCLIFLILGSPAWAQKATITLNLPDTHDLSGVLAKDINGDGLTDLVVSWVSVQDWKDRFIRIHLQPKNGDVFKNEPDTILDLPHDVAAFAVADAHQDPGKEVILFNANGAVLWRPLAKNGERFVKLLTCNFLWQLPTYRTVFALKMVTRDLNGDGLTDLFIPTPNGYRVAIQSREKGQAKFTVLPRLETPVPMAPPEKKKSSSVSTTGRETRISFEGAYFAENMEGVVFKPPLLDFKDATPFPYLLDFDGNGSLDLIVRDSYNMHLWKNAGSPHKTSAMDHSYEIPVKADLIRKIDVSYGTYFLDLDNNRRADCVIFAGDKNADSAKTQILIFVQGGSKNSGAMSPLFGDKGIPQQLLILAGYAGQPQFTDVNGDGLKDLVTSSFRPDLIDRMMTQASEQVEVELYVFLNKKRGFFSKTPDLRETFNLKLEGLGGLYIGASLRYFRDVTRDGVKELLVRDKPDRVRLYLSRKRAGAISLFLKKPYWEKKIHEEADLEFVEHAPEILILEKRRIDLVRF